MIISAGVFAQNINQNAIRRIDSLRWELANAKADTTRTRLLTFLSAAYFGRQIDSSIYYAKKSLALARRIHDTDAELWGLTTLAFTLSDRDIPKSMAMYFDIIKRTNEQNKPDLNRLEACYGGIGLLYLFLRNSQQSIYYQRKARKIALELKQPLIANGIASEIGEAFYVGGNLDSCRYYLTLAGKGFPQFYEEDLYLSYWGRAESIRNPMLALRYFQKSFRLAKASDDLRILSLCCRSFGDFCLQQNQLDTAIVVAREGLRAARQIHFYRGIYNNSTILAEAYKRLNRVDSAYNYQTIMVVARDSAFSQAKINQIQTTVIAEQQRAQLLEEEKSQLRQFGLLGLVFGLVIVAGILYRNDRQKQKVNTLLNHQKQEIETQRTKVENALTELRATQAQLIQKEKLASLGELTAGIAHEIQNPLNFVNNFSEVSTELVNELKEELDHGDTSEAKAIADDLSQNLQKITHHGHRASSIVKGMLEHSRTSTGEKQPTNLNALANEYLKLAYQGLRAKDTTFNCELVTEFDSALRPIEIMPQEIGRVLLNLYNNGFYAVHQKQKTTSTDYQPAVWVSTHRLANAVEIRVRDNGSGIADAVKAKIFQPFFTTKPTGEGTGLGLSLSYDIITKGHGGELIVESHEDTGTEFIIKLPAQTL